MKPSIGAWRPTEGKMEVMSVVAHASPARDPEIRRLRALYELVAALTKASALEEIYNLALSSLLDTTAADRAAILLFDQDGVIRFKASRGLSPEYQAAVAGHSPWPFGARDARPVIVSDALTNEGLAPYLDFLLRENIRGLAFLPLASDAGVFGKFMLYYAEPRVRGRRVGGSASYRVPRRTGHRTQASRIVARSQRATAARHS